MRQPAVPMFSGEEERGVEQIDDGIDLLPRCGGVYLILNLRTGRRRVGRAADVRQRCMDHRARLRRGDHDVRCVEEDAKQFGVDSFRYLLLERVDDARARVHREVEWTLRLEADDSVMGYNLAVGRTWGIESRFRCTERLLMRSGKYRLLPSVKLQDRVPLVILQTWSPNRESDLTDRPFSR